MAEDLDNGLFSIQLSDDDSSAENGSSKKPAAPRDAQSEAEFQAVRAGYTVKVENGEIHKSIALPLPDTGGLPLPKPEAQALLHAVEELYFFRRYDEGRRFVREVFADGDENDDVRGTGGGDDEGGRQSQSPPTPSRRAVVLDEDTRRLLRYYETKCAERIKADSVAVVCSGGYTKLALRRYLLVGD